MLTAAQIEERKKGIGASDARYIVEGRWHELWSLKTGKTEGEDLSGVFAVQLGNATETLNLDWYTRKTGNPVEDRGAAHVSTSANFMRCNLDGYDPVARAVIEAKHCNGFTKIEDARERYFPQVQHQMLVTGARKAILSVIIGTSEPVLEEILYDEFWANEYLGQCKEFWGYVERNEPPPLGAPMAVEAIAPDKMRTVSMEGNNAWAAGAADWIANRTAAKTFEGASKDLKTMIEADVKEASGHGIKISRSKAGSLTIKENK